MIKFFSVNKIKISVLFLLLLVIFSINIDLFDIKKLIYKNYPNLVLRNELFERNSIVENVNNDYNVKFLPDTQYVQLNLITKKIKFSSENYSKDKSTKSGIGKPRSSNFYLEIINNNLWMVDSLGKIYLLKKEQIIDSDPTNAEVKIIDSNFSAEMVLDTYAYNDNFYISFLKEENGCKTLNIVSAKINDESLNFKKFFESNECGDLILGGRMQFYKHFDKEGILITTSGHSPDKPNNKPQDDSSIFGKTLFLDLKGENLLVFSRGHRVAQGMYVSQNIILQTEHGPRGGDEINRIIYNKNYGWPISSYGEKYGTKTKEPSYIKNHSEMNFEEPIFSFVPSVGISELIKLPDTFSPFFKNNFLISSLNGRTLYRVKFDEKYTRLIFKENIFIGKRIRDLKFHDELNVILLALEEDGEIGIISKK